ncbi:MAG: hypothetical protein GF393_02610, partial [Armatimonadia bacterium]|nr:hypothetical protein [Armatimonadia bacterium]
MALLFIPAMLLSATALGASAQPAPLNADPGFEQTSAEDLGPWEVRYAIKASDPDSRPRWNAVSRMDPDDPDRGRHLAVEQFGPACGSVYVGQRVALPEQVPLVTLSLDYQTFCPLADRSGSLTVGVMLPETWDAISRDPLEAGVPPKSDAWLIAHTVHDNGEDRTEWTSARVPPSTLMRQLAPHAGQEVVMVVAWATWHDGHDEWARFDNFRLGQPTPWVDSVAWPTRTYRDEPLRVRVTAGGYGEFEVELRYRREAMDEWESIEMTEDNEPTHFRATVPGEALGEPVLLQAAIRHEGHPEHVTAEHTVRVGERPPRPNLIFTPAELQRMCEKADEYEWAGAIRDRIIRVADAWLERDDDPPAEQGGWSHDYVCPEDGARLRFREDHPRKHLCRACGKEWEGEKLDATWRSHMHGRFGSGARHCALAYQLTGDERYGRRAAEILLWYARNYHT